MTSNVSASGGEASQSALQCFECRQALAMQRYVLHESNPYCIKCYELKFANMCYSCSQLIRTDSKDVGFKEKHWHEKCFICNDCRSELIDKPFAYREDRLHCSACYDKNPSMCAGCTRPFAIGSKKYVYQSKQWHEECFSCKQCRTPIGTKPFIPHEADPYCSVCYENLFAFKCVVCTKVIEKGGLKYKGTPYHNECFTCTACNNQLSTEQFTIKDEKMYCVECYADQFAKKCTKCLKPITGLGVEGSKFASYEGRQWHIGCFKCEKCARSLVGEGFLFHGEDDIYCPKCEDLL